MWYSRDMTEGNGTKVYVPGKGTCTILSYEGNGYFTVLTNRDQQLFVPRNRIIFTRKRKDNGNQA